MISYTSSSESAMTPYHAIIHKRLGLITKALGRAYLAFCPEDERRLTMRLLESSEHPDGHMMTASGAIEQLIETTRRLGFAERVTAAVPEASSSVAVPIYESGTGKVLATIGLTYYASAVSRRQILDKYVPHLHTAAAAITENIARMNTTLAAERRAEPVRLAG
jgi:IclR family mhp operon transcriptional activator